MLNSQNKLRDVLRTHQRRLRSGDDLQAMTSIADRAGVHRDTLYALLNGERITPRSQYAIDKALREIEEGNIGSAALPHRCRCVPKILQYRTEQTA